ncbi:GntR family transcriptional regulator [Lentzea sp.]|uniref:GntR family transcriptional regulator n=1 Tax=Lentzea sp. TaxID=56099 RepID=UPI002C28D45A|nr:GntR family transcriptional regulator [Lentzea sp.]HUQ57842.1 GntR family transcriptional regulator [Lentzea sp.]
MPPLARPASHRGLAGEVADQVRTAILAGELGPGAPLKEADLMAEFDVSRSSAREGLLLLEGEGLVSSELHRGTRVRALEPEDVEELYTLRAALDGLAMRTAAKKGASFDALDAVVEEMRHARTNAERVALDMKFHDAVYEVAGHRRLIESWRAIRSQIHLFLLARIDGDPTYRELVVPEHLNLAAVLRVGDVEQAASAAEEHLRGSYEKLVGRNDRPNRDSLD